MLDRLLQNFGVRREIDAWLTDNCLRAAEALSEFASVMEFAALKDMQLLGQLDSKSDFIALKLAPALRQGAEKLTAELVEQAREELRCIVPVEVFRVRALNFVEPPASLFDRTFRTLSDRLPIGKGEDLRERARNFIIHTLLKGAKDAPSLLEQLEADYRSAAQRALKLP